MADVSAGNFSDINGNITIAGRDIINNIQTLYERALTPGEAAEKDLQLEINELARCVRDYLDRLKDQVVNAGSPDPYKGLEAYTFSEAEIFFGRGRAIRDLRHAMQRRALTVLQAESGAGKTSLLQAGIIPRLIAEQNLAILVRPQFDNPTQAIKKVFVGNLETTPKLSKAPLVDFLRRVSEIIGRQTTLYLILDQFEEFFAKKTLEQDRQEFIADLASCLNDPILKVRWVISITSDVFGQLGKFEPYIQNPFSNVQSLYLFNRKEAAEVISKPAEQHKLTFEDGLVECLLEDLDRDHHEVIAPTQIQLVCAALYEDIQEEDRRFTRERYDQRGCAQGILHDYIASVLNRSLPHEERAVAYKVFETLVTSEKRRVLRGRADLETALKKQGIASETLESTLNHLVKCRLLRCLGDDAQHLQYEIVHDYLLGEIEIDEGVRTAKEAEELLDQGLKNWDKQKLLLAPDALRILESQATRLTISSTAAKLLFLSAIEYNERTEPWRDLMSMENQKGLVDSLLTQKSSRKNREALWSLRHHLTQEQKTKVAVTRSSLVVLTSLQKGIIFLLIVAALLAAGALVVDRSNYYVPWTAVTSISKQCLSGASSSELLVAIDAVDSSRVIVYDPQSYKLCETPNTGARWKVVDKNLPAGLHVKSMAVHSGIYLATDQGLYYQLRGANWETLKPPAEHIFSVQNIAISSDQESLYVSTQENLLYKYDRASGDWEAIATDGITGNITGLAVNFNYLAVSTADGVWYRKLNPETPWLSYEFRLDEPVHVTSIKMVYPIKPPSSDPGGEDWFLATTEKGELYSGFLTEVRGLARLSRNFANPSAPPILSLAVNGYSKFSSRPDGLYCEQTWTILDAEWWLRSKFSNRQPCR